MFAGSFHRAAGQAKPPEELVDADVVRHRFYRQFYGGGLDLAHGEVRATAYLQVGFAPGCRRATPALQVAASPFRKIDLGNTNVPGYRGGSSDEL